MTRLSGLALAATAYVVALALIPLTGPQMPQGLRLLLLLCATVGLVGVMGAAGMFSRSGRSRP